MNNSRSTKISVGMFYQIQSDIYIEKWALLEWETLDYQLS